MMESLIRLFADMVRQRIECVFYTVLSNPHGQQREEVGSFFDENFIKISRQDSKLCLTKVLLKV